MNDLGLEETDDRLRAVIRVAPAADRRRDPLIRHDLVESVLIPCPGGGEMLAASQIPKLPVVVPTRTDTSLNALLGDAYGVQHTATTHRRPSSQSRCIS